MDGPFLTDRHMAKIYDRVTGAVMEVAVPTAVENVRNDPVRFGHGDKCPADERIKAPVARPVFDISLALQPDNGGLAEEGTLDMPRDPDPQVEMLRGRVDVLTVERDEALSKVQELRGLIQEYETDLANAKARAEAAEAEIAKMDGDGDGAVGGSAPAAAPARTPRGARAGK